jgi:uncharacterized membrane protein
MDSQSDRSLAGWRLLFLVAALYDMVLGAVFFFAYEPLFEWLPMPLPPHVAYIQLSAVFVFVQGLSYLLVAQRPLANLGLVRVGIAYKAGYAGLALYYLATDQIPAMFFAWFGLFDLAFLVAFAWFLYHATRVPGDGTAPA